MKLSETDGRTLKATLTVLVLVCTVPIALAAAGLIYLFIIQEYQRAERELRDRTALMLSAVELRMENILEDLQVLAASPSLQSGDLETFRSHMARANGIYNGFGTVLVERSGQLVLSTRRQPGDALPKRTLLETQERVFVSGKPHISGLVKSTAADVPIISIEVPVIIDGEVRYVLAAGIAPEYVAEVMKKSVPEGWLASIADRNSILIARVPQLNLVGQPMIDPLRQKSGVTSDRWFKTSSRDGTPIYSYAVVSPELGWTAFMSIPQGLVARSIRWNAAALAGAVILALVAGLLTARRLSRRIVATLHAFEENVAALSHKRDLKPIPTRLVELNRMQDALIGVKRELLASERQIETERNLLRETVRSMPVGVVIIDPDGKVIVVNSKARELWGAEQLNHFDDFKDISRRRLDGTVYPPQEWPIIKALKNGALTQNEEVIHLQSGGTAKRLSINAAPVRDTSGETIAAVAAFYDTTELNAALDQHKLLLEEINHRVNNTMATIQAIAVLTKPGVSTVAEYVGTFQKRLLALAQAYRLLTDNNWQGADLWDIAEGILAPYEKQVNFVGPRVRLSANHALAIAAALQELATNAAKYGSLSVTSGRLVVQWIVDGDNLTLEWLELGGPPVLTPTRKGFGSRFIQDTLARQVGWVVHSEYAPEGFKLTLTLGMEKPAGAGLSAA